MIGVVAHTARAEAAHRLMETVGAAYMSIDDGTLGCEKNHHKTWTWLAEHNRDEWCVVLEDDAIPVPQFTTQLASALDAAPASIVSLYLGRKRPPHWQNAIDTATHNADQADACWITAPQLIHAVAVAIKTSLIPGMLELTGRSIRPWDYAIGEYAQRNNEPVLYTWPSLFEHADQPTVAKHRDREHRHPGRTAWKTGTRTIWNNTSVNMLP